MSIRSLPAWFRQPIPSKETIGRMARVRASGARTVCREAHCPNFGACLGSGRLTFLILGPACTRRCRFCSVEKDTATREPDQGEPAKIVSLLREFNTRYCVITSVTRDDLADGGAGQFCAVIRAVRQELPGVKIELLIPDFGGDPGCCAQIVGERPDAAGHNIETVARLYRELRPQSQYERSLKLLSLLKRLNGAMLVKSSLMLGLGETEGETLVAMADVRSAGCDALVLGQYLAPSPQHAPVREFVTPDKFERLRQKGLEMGFKAVLAGPLARSSYRAEEIFNALDGTLHTVTHL